jgi:hypothetical protein
MMNAIRHDELPSFYFMHPPSLHYGAASYFIVKPPVATKRSEDGKPLSSTARRAGWVGCNFALNRIPVEARISVVTTIMSPSPPQRGGEIPSLAGAGEGGRRSDEGRGDQNQSCGRGEVA